MSTQKRGRACLACASIKIKCALGSEPSLQPPCERCVRLNKECVLSAPKRQKDRVAELEAQVAALTRLLKTQGIDNPDAPSLATLREGSGGAAASSLSKKRRLDETTIEESSNADISSPTSTSVISISTGSDVSADTLKLDHILSRELQQRVLDRYKQIVAPTFPLVPITGDTSLDVLRRERPILLQAIMYAAGMGVLPLEVQEDIARLLLNRLATGAITQNERSLELIQAIQIVCIWYRSPKHHRHVAVYQLIQLTSGLAMDIGMAGPLNTPSTGFISEACDLEAIDCWRAWLACYSMSAAMSIFMRQENSTPWSDQLEQCLVFLPSSPVGLPSDKWLGQFFRAERLCEQIASLLGFSDLYTCNDVSEPEMKMKIQTCRNYILNWRVTIPQSLRTPLILFWENLATAYMYEPILWTSTNKQSFTAPYVSEKLSLTDFPAPAVVTQDHITAVYELLSATHAMIDVFASFDAQTLTALSGLFVTSRVAYANYVLAKLYIATTMPGNTLGSIVDSTIIRADEYNDKLFDAMSRVGAVDDRCSSARILGTASRMREWYASYNNNLYSEDGLLNPTTGLQFDSYLPAIGVPPVTGAASPTQKAADWETFFRFSDSAADFGLDILFAEPMPGLDEAYSGLPFGEPFQQSDDVRKNRAQTDRATSHAGVGAHEDSAWAA